MIDYLSCKDFEKISGIKERTLQRLAKAGIIGKRFGRDWFFTKADLSIIERKNLRKPKGWPRKSV